MSVISKTGSVCLAAATFAAVWFNAARSEACTRDLPPVGLVGYPSHGAFVPTDVLPIYEILPANVLTPEMLTTASFVLRSASGTVVPTTPAISTYPGYFELTLAEQLTPYTTYVLEATLPSRQPFHPPDPVKHTITFWTGEGPATPPAAPNDLLIQNYAYDGPIVIDSCDPPRRGTCVAAQGPFTVLQNEESIHPPTLLKAPAMISFMAGATGCLTLRTRGPNGALSEPVRRCADTTPLFQLSSMENVECTSAGLVETKPVSANPPPACSMSAGSVPGSRGWLAGALGVLGLLWVQRARRSRIAAHERTRA